MEDHAIVELYWQRSDSAILETEKKYGSYCHSIAYGICASHEDAEECVNDTWLKAWNLMPDKRPRLLSVFLGGITRNYAIDRYRSDTRQKRGGGETALALDELAFCVPAAEDTESLFEAGELERAIDSFTASLPETERRIFLARYWFVLPVAEIAARLDMSQSRVKSSLFRVRKRLRTFLKGEGLF